MEKGALARWLLLGLAAFLLITYLPSWWNGSSDSTQPLVAEGTATPRVRSPESLCAIDGPRFKAELTTRGASVRHFWLTEKKYQRDGQPIDVSTTPDQETRRQLLTSFRSNAVEKGPGWLVPYDVLDWELASKGGSSCTFRFATEQVEITKTIAATERPYELATTIKTKNLSDKTLRYVLSSSTSVWRTNKETEGGMFRVSPFVTHVECILEGGSAKRLRTGDFDPGDFTGEPFARTATNPGDWYAVPGVTDVAAVSNAYFTSALVPLTGPTAPQCQLQIEERWSPVAGGKKAPNAGSFYRARLAYQPIDVKPKEVVEHSLVAFVGPKEREALAASSGAQHQLTELIDLGFFSIIAKVLVSFLLAVYSVIPNWGLAIIVLTIVARTALFPLTIPSIRSMIKMRELKPEVDAINEKFKDDAQARGLAQMELWRKHKVNPLKGCLPQLASMPVWFALYTTLQTAVELYGISFLWFPDLSEPDPYFILPFIIGGTSFVQQKIMPIQQGDPMQQKMMLYMMPAMFTVFMLFLPAGLGVYMFTNSLLGIVQQQAVEWHVRRTNAKKGGPTAEPEPSEPSRQGGRPRKGGGAGSSELTERRPLLGKGKA